MRQKRVIIALSLFLILVVFMGCQEQTDEVNEQKIDPDESSEAIAEDKDRDETTLEEDPNNENEHSEDALHPEEEEEETEALYKIDQDTWNVEPITDEANKDVVLLTIDDAPEKYGLEMAHILDELNAPAIFFVNGHFIQTEEQQDALREIHELGFAIGNHTYNHSNLKDISEDEQRKEIVELNDLIEEVIGERPKFFRAPHGANTDFSEELVKQEGMVMMNWTYGYDYFEPYMDKEKLTEAMITGEGPEVDVDYSLLKPGANLLMHDREWTKDALADIVTGLREQGYEMVDPDLIEKNIE